MEELDKPRIQEMLKLVSQPEASLLILRSKTFEATGECTQEDKYFGTKYVKQPYSESLLGAMKHPEKLVSDGAKLGLPPVNPLLPKNLDLVPVDPEHSNHPKLIKEYPGDTEVWYMKDEKF